MRLMEETMEPVTLTIRGTCRALGLGTTKIYQLVSCNRLQTIKAGRRTLVTTDSIRAFVAEQLSAGGQQ